MFIHFSIQENIHGVFAYGEDTVFEDNGLQNDCRKLVNITNIKQQQCMAWCSIVILIAGNVQTNTLAQFRTLF